MKPIDEFTVGARIVASSEQFWPCRRVVLGKFHHNILYQEELTVHPLAEINRWLWRFPMAQRTMPNERTLNNLRLRLTRFKSSIRTTSGQWRFNNASSRLRLRLCWSWCGKWMTALFSLQFKVSS